MSDMHLPASEPLPSGMGAAAFLLMIGLISRLKANGLLSLEDGRLIIDEAMLALEQTSSLTIPETKGAHGLMQALLAILEGAQHPPTPSS